MKWGLVLGIACALAANALEFRVDYEKNCFLKDGKPFQMISGSIHYYNVPEGLWEDRLESMKNCGMNTVQTYAEWRSLEPRNGVLDFSGRNDIVGFIKTAQRVGLLVNIRLGPYIDSERDMGGLPWWLLQVNPEMELRAHGPEYLFYVFRFWRKLLPLLEPLLYSRGGPIVMVQIENEYGSYSACDFVYTAALRDFAIKILGERVVYYTTDGASDRDLKCGKIEGLLTTVDFGAGANVLSEFNSQRRHQRRGPLVNSEFYTGWLDHWGAKHSTVPMSDVCDTLNMMLAMNASVNLYMFHGGTHFGFDNGANLGTSYQPCPTSYDYDAPLTEAGDPTEKYFAIKSVIAQYAPVPENNPIPKLKAAFGHVALRKRLDLETALIVLKRYAKTNTSTDPLSFESLGLGYGLAAYEVKIPFRPFSPSVLKVPGLRDRGYVYVDLELQGILSREVDAYEIPLNIKFNQTLTILVENQGRVCFGDGIKDLKGIIQPVQLGNHTLKNWQTIPFPYMNVAGEDMIRFEYLITAILQKQWNSDDLRNLKGFGAYQGVLTIPNENGKLLDSYVKFSGWGKGFVYINSMNLGRYWPNQGPQVTLYVPSTFFRFGENHITVVELEQAPANMTISFVDQHEIAGPVPENIESNNPLFMLL